ncbi:MAG TPA: hypothetical protein VK589_12515 [Chryseolinea sp.]|nr:hypothetical protein [Chryseolinea sp.]
MSVLIVLCVVHFNASAQQAALDTLTKKFNNYRSTYATEKIYAHIDQQLYLTGETLWFKIYLVDGSLHKPAEVSKVGYVEILDNNNHPVLQTKVSLKDGRGNGSLFLPAVIEGGNYTFRAYTSWMKNFGPEYFFHSNVSIINTFKKLDLDKSNAQKIDAQFFPEGGNLVYGLKSKIAFRVTNAQGVGISFSGAIVDQQNDTVTTFQPAKFGIGNFYLTPEQGKEYRAIVDDEQKRRNTFKLPSINESGYVMLANDSTENEVALKIDSRVNEGSKGSVVYVFVHTRNMVASASMNFLKDGRTTVLIPKRNLREGISHITVFDSDMRPVAERLYFKQITKRLTVEVTSNQREFGIRRKVSLDLNVKDAEGQPQTSDLSLAVYKADSLTRKSGNNILNYLWLTSDLKGNVESPEYYLNHSDPEVRLNVDNLMLTHGWRRFTWNDVLSKSSLKVDFVPEYRGHIIRGKVSRPGEKATSGVLTYLSAPARNIQVYGSTSTDNGDVKYEMKDFSGPRKIIVQTNTNRDSISTIEIMSPFSDRFGPQRVPAFKLAKTLEPLIISRSIGMQVQDVFYQDRNKIVASGVDTTAFYGKADAMYYLDDYTRFPVMEEILREYVPGVMVRKRRDGFHFLMLDEVNRKVFDEDPLVLLDGIPIFDIDKIMEFNPLNVRKLEVLTRRYYMGVLSLPGVVSFTTYAGDLAGFQLNPRSVQLNYDGLQLQREFYSPLYETSKLRDSRLPDQRQLLFWAPEVITGKDGKKHVEFFTSDITGDYEVVVEGMTSQGVSGKGTGSFAVRPYEN